MIKINKLIKQLFNTLTSEYVVRTNKKDYYIGYKMKDYVFVLLLDDFKTFEELITFIYNNKCKIIRQYNLCRYTITIEELITVDELLKQILIRNKKDKISENLLFVNNTYNATFLYKK